MDRTTLPACHRIQDHAERKSGRDNNEMKIRSALRYTIAAAILASGEACDGRDAKAVAIVKRELALLEPPAGIAPPDQQTGLGEMYAEGSQTYCVNDEKTAQRSLDTMLRNAGWKPVSASTTADATIWHYRKGQSLASLNLAKQPQPCGRRFRVDVLEPL